jgi:hypothetical protein
MTFTTLAITVALLGQEPKGLAPQRRPAVIVRLDEPGRQLRAILDLFQGSRTAHPAAALAAWKRASREPGRLGKPLEALIAAFNPSMVEELRLLDGSELTLWLRPEDGGVEWTGTIPRDDGTFAALASSLVLSGGAPADARDGLAVDRLGPPGSPLMVKTPLTLIVASSTESLDQAVRRPLPSPIRADATRPGLRFDVPRGVLEASRSTSVRRLAVAMEVLRGSIEGRAAVVGPTLESSFSLSTEFTTRPPGLDPGWLDWIPVDRSALAFAAAIDSSPTCWEGIFRLADAVEKVAPDRARLAPARLRLGLLARTLGIPLEVEVLPHLRGLSGWVGGNGSRIDRAFLGFHLDGEDPARRIFDKVRPVANPAGPIRSLGRVEGQELILGRFGASIVVAWGADVLESSLRARDLASRPARSMMLDDKGPAGTSLVVAVWPGRWPGLIEEGGPLALGLARTSPITWRGDWEAGRTLRLQGRWRGLDAGVRRFLESIPLDPPPDR